MDPLHNPEDLLLALAVSPPRTFDVPPDAVIRPGEGESIYDGLTVTSWTHDG